MASWSASGAVLIWRLQAESRGLHAGAVEQFDRRAHKLVAVMLFGLAVYVFVEAARTLWLRERPHASLVGMALTAVALIVIVARGDRPRGRASRSSSATPPPSTSRPGVQLVGTQFPVDGIF